RIPSDANARRDFVSPSEVNRVSDAASRLVLCWQILFLDAETCVDRQPSRNRPGILSEKRVVDAGRLTARTVIENVDVSVLTRAGAIQRDERRAIRLANRTKWCVGRALPNEVLHQRHVVVLIDAVVQVIELVSELEVMRPQPSA